ncbi:hypothetical protein Q8A67_017528 [Cirrhinus molitorella]|uniref:G-protein coupled receptors family 1 profile domain-containing protein n=1 Tax=Cirrhinus molitorella TaxID=172907 RepID=A0AA88PEA6_9TELE|nr:hypothetical protein Q8A67_017528 [Cirrhinus molitorella]
MLISNETDIENVFLCYPLLPDSCPRAQRLTILKVAMYVVMVLMILTTVFGNLLVIISISHFKQLQSPTHMIVQSLAACDCLLGSLVMPYSMVRSVEGCWYLGDVVCKVHSSLDMTFSISSILHLSLIAIDRAHRLPALKIAIYVFMVLMILTTVFGNLLIIISISHFKQLQSPTHLIVRSLAASDCLLGSLVMPYSMG